MRTPQQRIQAKGQGISLQENQGWWMGYKKRLKRASKVGLALALAPVIVPGHVFGGWQPACAPSSASHDAEQFVLHYWRKKAKSLRQIQLVPASERHQDIAQWFQQCCTRPIPNSPALHNFCSFNLTDVYNACYRLDGVVDSVLQMDTSALPEQDQGQGQAPEAPIPPSAGAQTPAA